MNPQAIALWYEALNSPLGIGVRVPDMTRAKSILYSTRAKLGDADLMSLSIRTSPASPTDTLWLVKG